MTATHEDVARRLAKKDLYPENSLKGSSMEYLPAKDNKPATIIGYGWAVYAVRYKDAVIIFGDWTAHWGQTTQRHLKTIRDAADNNQLWIIDAINKQVDHWTDLTPEQRQLGEAYREQRKRQIIDDGLDTGNLPDGRLTTKHVNKMINNRMNNSTEWRIKNKYFQRQR